MINKSVEFKYGRPGIKDAKKERKFNNPFRENYNLPRNINHKTPHVCFWEVCHERQIDRA